MVRVLLGYRAIGVYLGNIGERRAKYCADQGWIPTFRVSFESKMADIRKVVDFESPEAFKKMGDDIRADVEGDTDGGRRDR